MTLNDIEQTMRSWNELFTWQEHNDYCRIRTPFLYPDGDYIDLFFKTEGNTVLITDLAETIGWLEIQRSSMCDTPMEDKFILDICNLYGVEFCQGELQARCFLGDNLAEVLARVAQAALQISGLWFSIRAGRVIP